MKNSRRMFLGALFATVALFSVVGTALAQDPLKAAPNNYEVLFENDRAQVLEFRGKPGEKTPMLCKVCCEPYRTRTPRSGERACHLHSDNC